MAVQLQAVKTQLRAADEMNATLRHACQRAHAAWTAAELEKADLRSELASLKAAQVMPLLSRLVSIRAIMKC